MAADTLATLLTKAGDFPQKFNKREARLAKIINDGIDTSQTGFDEANFDEDILRIATGTLTQAQLQAIGTPISLIAAPGAGKVLVVDEVELFHDYATAAYTSGADLQIEYATSGTNIALVADTFVTGTSDQSAILKPSTYGLDGSTGTGVGFDVTANANKAVQITGTNFADGNASNIVKWRIRYRIITLLT
jgi:hypothetical protein